MATDYTDGLALKAMKNVFDYLPTAYNEPANVEARQKMADASCMAGMAFANAFLGVCHSMAHKLGAFHHLPHGVANALLISLVVDFNSAENPRKMGTSPSISIHIPVKGMRSAQGSAESRPRMMLRQFRS